MWKQCIGKGGVILYKSNMSSSANVVHRTTLKLPTIRKNLFRYFSAKNPHAFSANLRLPGHRKQTGEYQRLGIGKQMITQ